MTEYQKVYIPEGATVFCDGAFLKVQSDSLIFDEESSDARTMFNGHEVFYDADKQKYYYETIVKNKYAT